MVSRLRKGTRLLESSCPAETNKCDPNLEYEIMSIDVTTIIVAVRFRVSKHQNNSVPCVSETWQHPGREQRVKAGNSKLHGESLQAKLRKCDPNLEYEKKNISTDVTTITVAVRFRVSRHQNNSVSRVSETWQHPGCEQGIKAGHPKLHGESLQAKLRTCDPNLEYEKHKYRCNYDNRRG